MSARRGRAAALRGALVVGWLVLAAPAGRAQPGAADEQRDARAAELSALRNRIAALEGRLSELEQQGKGLLDQVERSGFELRLQAAKVAEATAARAAAGDALEHVERRAAELERRLAQRRAELRRRLRLLQHLGGQGYLGLLLGLRDRTRVLEGVRMVRYLVRRDARAIADFRTTGHQLAATRVEHEVREREMVDWLRRERERRAALQAAAQRARELMRALEREQGTGAALAAALRDQEQRLADLIATLQATAATGLVSQPIERFRGALDRPIAGAVLVPFGPRRDPRYGTTVPNNGVEFSCPSAGAPVRAVYPGRVLFAAPFEDFGFTVVVQHSARALTLYAGLSEVLVATGDMLDLTAVGRCAERVYFELRFDNRPQDPLAWLR